MGITFYKNGDDICRVHERLDADGNHIFYQITMFELSDDGQEFEVFYLERCREYDTLIKLLMSKGIDFSSEWYYPTTDELMMIIETCV